MASRLNLLDNFWIHYFGSRKNPNGIGKYLLPLSMPLRCIDAVVPSWQRLEYVSKHDWRILHLNLCCILMDAKLLRFQWTMSHCSQAIRWDQTMTTKFFQMHKVKNARIGDKGLNQGSG